MRILGFFVIGMGTWELLYEILTYLRDGGFAQVSVIWHDWVRDEEFGPVPIPLLAGLAGLAAALLAAILGLVLTRWIYPIHSKPRAVAIVGLAAVVYGLAMFLSSPPIKLLLLVVVIGIGAGIRSRHPENGW